MGDILLEMIDLMTDGIAGIGSAIGRGLSELASSVFIVEGTSGSTLSTFGALICIFAGISLCLGLIRLVINWLTGFGKGGM